MKISQKAFLAYVLLSAVLVGTGFALEQRYLLALISLSLGPAWWYGHRRRLEWMETLMAAALFLAAAAVLMLDGPIWAVLPGVVFTLSGWDLGNFDARLRKVPATPETRKLEQKHLLILAKVNGLGFGITAAVLLVQIRLSLWVAMLLALLVVIGLNQVYKGLKSWVE
jgi:hypothetical protein